MHVGSSWYVLIVIDHIWFFFTILVLVDFSSPCWTQPMSYGAYSTWTYHCIWTFIRKSSKRTTSHIFSKNWGHKQDYYYRKLLFVYIFQIVYWSTTSLCLLCYVKHVALFNKSKREKWPTKLQFVTHNSSKTEHSIFTIELMTLL